MTTSSMYYDRSRRQHISNYTEKTESKLGMRQDHPSDIHPPVRLHLPLPWQIVQYQPKMDHSHSNHHG